ncbi:DNA-binding transcriptional LysR family regulator [Parapusillimonas granuli]|nr:DNA-binding transcriptional LysR family regulator [Parapusillimonas granuli]
MALFVEVAERKSLSRAAEAMSMSNAAASRHLRSLETRLGARLVERNTRRLYLTDVGQDFYRRCRSILADSLEAEASVHASTMNPTGMLRVTASLSFCLNHIAPLIPAFTRQYPNLNLDVVASNRYYDLIDNNIDVAIRTREHEPDSNITIRKLAGTRRILAASPRYLELRGMPRTIEDLNRHSMLIYTYANKPDELRFRKNGKTSVWSGKGLLNSNDGQVLRSAAMLDLGILVQPKYIIYDDIAAGRLVSVLDDWSLPHLTINIAYPNRQFLPIKSRAFIDFLADHFKKMDFERKWTT